MKAVKRYLRSPAGVIGAVLLLVVIAAALSAGWLFPRDPLALAGRPLQWPGANPSCRSAPTIRAATSPRSSSTARASRC